MQWDNPWAALSVSQMEYVLPIFLLELKAFSAISQACFYLLHVIKS